RLVLRLEHGGFDAVLKHVGLPQPREAVRGIAALQEQSSRTDAAVHGEHVQEGLGTVADGPYQVAITLMHLVRELTPELGWVGLGWKGGSHQLLLAGSYLDGRAEVGSRYGDRSAAGGPA